MAAPIPRLEMAVLDSKLAAMLAPRVKRLGYLGEFFKCTAAQPRALIAFMELTEALKLALPDNLTEVVAMSVAGATGNDYERNQHERLASKLGFARDWIAAVSRREPAHAAPLSEAERAVQRLTLAVLEKSGHGVHAELEQVIAAIGNAQSIAALMLIGRCAMHAMIANALELAPPVQSIFAEPRK